MKEGLFAEQPLFYADFCWYALDTINGSAVEGGEIWNTGVIIRERMY